MSNVHTIVVPEGFDVCEIKMTLKPGKIPVKIKERVPSTCRFCNGNQSVPPPENHDDICNRCYFREKARFERLIHDECFCE